MPSLSHCIYASAATHNFEDSDLVRLLQRARENNDHLGVTGMLLHAEGSFFQVLEGDPQVVAAVYAQIGLDKRHEQVTTIISEPIARRSFDTWTMGFSRLSRDDLAEISGVNDFFGEAHCFGKIDPGRANKLLRAFGEGRWRTKLSGDRQPAHN
jgi:hypothetical protein